MNVEHFMTKDPIACEFDDSCRDVAKLMRDKGIGAVVVLRNGRVAGIVTDRQLAVKVLAEGKDADSKVREVMTTNPATLTLEDNLFSAIDSLRSAGVVSRLPVVNAENQLIGLVSLSDIALIAKDLIDAVLLDQTHHALEEARVLTGAKRLVDKIRRPTKTDRLLRKQETIPVTRSSVGQRLKAGRRTGAPRRGTARTGQTVGTRRGSTRRVRKRVA